jgi:hypothetical protein
MDYGNQILGMIGGLAGSSWQNQQQRELMALQHKNQMSLNQQGSALQYDLWKKTSFPGQMEMLKKAGLSPGLMYKQGGASGTTGSQTGGSAASGNAAQFRVMDMNAMKLQAEIEAIKEGVEKSKWERGVKGEAEVALINANIKNVSKDTLKKVQETSNLKTVDELNKFEKDLKELRVERGKKGMLQGDTLGNLLDAVGLDPVNNEADRDLIQSILIGMGVLRTGESIGRIVNEFKDGFTGKRGKKSNIKSIEFKD